MAFQYKADVIEVEVESSGSNVDYDALREETIEAFGTSERKKKTLVGYVSGIYDLGKQPKADFEEVFDALREAHTKAIDKGYASTEVRDVFWDNGKKLENVEVFIRPQRDTPAVALAVDFPSITLDKGKYFDESNPAPARLIMGSEGYVKNPDKDDKKMPVVANPFYLKEVKDDKFSEPTLGTRTTLYRMGEAAELLRDTGVFKVEDIGNLLGKPFLFEVQVFNKPNKKSPNNTFYTEKIKFTGEVPEGMPIPDMDESLLHGTYMESPNQEECLNQLRAVLKNTMRRASNWEYSVIKKELEELYKSRSDTKSDTPEGTDESEEEVDLPEEPEIPEVEDEDEDF